MSSCARHAQKDPHGLCELMWGGLLWLTCCRFLRFLTLWPQRGSVPERAGLQRQLITAEWGHCCGLSCSSASCSSGLISRRRERNTCALSSTWKMQVVNRNKKASRHGCVTSCLLRSPGQFLKMTYVSKGKLLIIKINGTKCHNQSCFYNWVI